MLRDGHSRVPDRGPRGEPGLRGDAESGLGCIESKAPVVNQGEMWRRTLGFRT